VRDVVAVVQQHVPNVIDVSSDYQESRWKTMSISECSMADVEGGSHDDKILNGQYLIT
jgi:hypothetical protein